jgi:hypothetical protein
MKIIMILLQNGCVINGGGVGSLGSSHGYGQIVITINGSTHGPIKKAPTQGPGLDSNIISGK